MISKEWNSSWKPSLWRKLRSSYSLEAIKIIRKSILSLIIVLTIHSLNYWFAKPMILNLNKISPTFKSSKSLVISWMKIYHYLILSQLHLINLFLNQLYHHQNITLPKISWKSSFNHSIKILIYPQVKLNCGFLTT